MPSFGRLGKHSNRSQHGISEQQQQQQQQQQALPSASSNIAATSPTAAPQQPSNGGVGVGVPGVAAPLSSLPGSFNAGESSPTDSPLDNPGAPHQSAPLAVGTALTSHDHVDPRQLPPQAVSQTTPNKLQKQPPNPPPHLYNTSSSSAAAGVNPSPLTQNPGGDIFFDGRQAQHQSPSDFAASADVSRSQSQRYPSQHSLHLQQQQQQQLQQLPPQQQQASQQQQQLYGVATSSADELPSPASFNQQPLAQTQPPPEKHRSNRTRHIIKGIFGSVRGTQDTAGSNSNSNNNSSSSHSSALALAQAQAQSQGQSPIHGSAPAPPGHAIKGRSGSYDNTAGLARRPSKRVSNLSHIKTSLPHQASFAQDSHRDPSQNQSQLVGVGEDDEYYSLPNDSNPSPLTQDSRLPPLSAVRPVGVAIGDLDSSPYDEENYEPPPHPPPGHQQPPHQTQQQHGQPGLKQEQQLHFDSNQGNLDNLSASSQQQQLHQQLLLQQSEGRLPAGYSQNVETSSQFSQESPAPEQDLRAQAPQILQPGAQPGTRPSQDTDRALRGQADTTSGGPSGYRHSNAGLNPVSPMPQHSSQSNPAFRERAGQLDGATMEQRGDSPQPSTSEKDVESEKAFKELLTKYKNVKRLYFDGKSQIDQLNGQIEHLQNAVANQRMSQSRTALDDSEYATRFNRMNGAINNLSFNIRKDWRCLPQWLTNYVSADALKTGKQEMTAVGRAVISRWLVEEIFNKCFHPGLEPQLSAQLKEVEQGIRGNSHTIHSQEEFDALTTKVVNWRMATLDGLQRRLSAQETAENRNLLISKATTNLAACLYQYLNDPPPAGVEGSTSMIVELAVGIAANLPLESRDVAITYPLPGVVLQPNLMEVEKTGLPSLDPDASDDEDDEEAEKDKNGKPRDKSKSIKDPTRIRFAGFMALEVKGRQVLMKAPVWTL